jgi:hypothetical protein
MDDRVGTAGRHGVFAVVGIDKKRKTADLRSLGGTRPTDEGIPWSMLVYLDEGDANQAAARVVREATDKV